MRDVFKYQLQPKQTTDFNAIRLSLLPPEKILEESYGEVKKAETLNYRTFKPEQDGLFCAKIFGPVKDYECNCGKYKRRKHQGIVCEKCGVEVIESKVRRERMGHITLTTPVAHPWFLKSLPSRIGTLLGLTLKDAEKLIYYESYLVLDPKDTPLRYGQYLDEEQYKEAVLKYGEGSFVAKMGAEAVYEYFKNMDLEVLAADLHKKLKEVKSQAQKERIIKRLSIVDALLKSGNRPEWMILKVIPVIPPDLRPLVHLEGGRFATSDLNDLYRRVINRNNRLKRLIEIGAPEIIVRNEKRMLQEAIDALFDNSRKLRAVTGTNGLPLKSLSDIIKGKSGRFRQNLLGKRVDYSGRSAIVVGPELKLHQCGLPKIMALELFKPFIFRKLLEKGFVNTIKAAKKMVDEKRPEVWEILEDVIREHPVLLNRAPTLHRLGIQAFEPILVEGKAIVLHPLVCVAYNADFDGDQMAVHIPLSLEAQIESRVLLMSTNNILKPANGKPIIGPTQDMVLGLNYITIEKPFVKGEGKVFSSLEEVRMAYETGKVDIHARIEVRLRGRMYKTTVGRVLLADSIPSKIPFSVINKPLKKGDINKLLEMVYNELGEKETVLLADRLMRLGFKYATKSGISICVDDMSVPEKKAKIIEQARKKVKSIEKQWKDGILTEDEKINNIIDIWSDATNKVTEALEKCVSEKEYVDPKTGKKKKGHSFNSIFMMKDSGARGSIHQVRQLAGMRGLMAKPSGEIIQNPIISNFREGLGVLEYFISTHGARKGLADTALKTANSGYLTRKLVDVAHNCTITMKDCGTINGIEISALVDSGEIIEPLADRILGRVAAEPIIEPITEKVIVEANQEIDEKAVERIVNSGITKVMIRSVLTCEATEGVCQLCYGRDLGRGRMVNIGEAVGVIAAQSIGEPGTQLTMRTFHIGGTASSQVEQSSIETKFSGKVKLVNVKTVTKKDGTTIVMNRNGQFILIDKDGREKEKYDLVYGAELKVKDGQNIKAGTLIAKWDPYARTILTEVSGYVKYGDLIDNVTIKGKIDEITGKTTKSVIKTTKTELRPRISIKDKLGEGAETLQIPGTDRSARYDLPVGAIITVDEGDYVEAGDVIAKIPRELTKTKDITGGLPRVQELFEARRPKDAAIVSEIDGVVKISRNLIRGTKRKVEVIPEVGEKKVYFIPREKHILVQDGDTIKAGEQICDGQVDPHDILRILGLKELARYLVDEIQKVYKLQGVSINDKHIEVIIRQMITKVKIVDSGDSRFLQNEEVDRRTFEKVNQKLIKEGKKPASAEPILVGITKASLTTDSFISAASFQETTRVLTKAALEGQIDYLKGLKENIIIGGRIPAGTGLDVYRNFTMEIKEPKEEVDREHAVS